ncbi:MULTISPECIES: FecR family protein [Butyricimonas]|uniref:FecR family protein n=1 Tax=Butyricimonas TaxID=574697 RepID=UPI0007FB525E|nr:MULTISPECIES: FecR domain-containing protein [Butyricimonas]
MEREYQITESELLDFFNGKLSAAEEKEILEWKEACDENREVFDAARRENFVMRQVVRAQLIKGEYSSIRGRIGGTRRRSFKLWHGVAAAVVVAVVSSVVLWQDDAVDKSRTMASIGSPARKAILEMANGGQHYLGGREIEFKERDGAQVAISSGKVVYDKKLEENAGEEKEDVLVYDRITIPRGAGLYRISLNDGSVVWLNSDSRLEYPEKFARGERRVRVTGEAFFEVARDTARPFVVETVRQAVTVLGTKFNVSAYPSEPELTTLASGKVKVVPVHGTEAVVLSPGEQSVLGVGVDSLRVCQVNVSDVVAWKDGMISIENMALSEVLKVVSRAYDVDFETGSLPGEDIILRGSISSDETLEVFLAVLSKVADVKFKMNADGKIEVQKLE